MPKHHQNSVSVLRLRYTIADTPTDTDATTLPKLRDSDSDNAHHRKDFTAMLLFELCIQILSFSDDTPICRVGHTCKSWHNISSHDAVWRSRYDPVCEDTVEHSSGD